MADRELLIPAERIERAILLIRGEKVMLDADLADLYGVETKGLNPGGQTEPVALPGRLHVSADAAGR